MTVPFAITSELDGALGVLPPSSGLPLAVIGQCAAGTKNTPASYTRVSSITDDFASGRAVELAAYAVGRFGVGVLLCRSETTTAKSLGAVDNTNMAGTSNVSIDGASEPADDYEIKIKFPSGGTVGAAGITYQLSFDGGQSFGPVTALGTADSLTASAEGITLDLSGTGSATVIAGDYATAVVHAKACDDGDLADALDALGNSVVDWDLCVVADPCDQDMTDAIDAFLAAQHAAGKHRAVLCSFRLPTVGESEADYLTAFNVFLVRNTSRLTTAGAVRCMSSVSRGRRYQRPVVHPVAALAAKCSGEIDLAALDSKYGGDQGPLPGVTIRDAAGNLVDEYHDEQINPGLDSAGACVVRTWDGYSGVYVNNPRLSSAADSDFDFLQKRRVMNEARTIVDRFMARRLSKPLQVNPKTGFVREAELLSIEAECNALLASRLLAKPKASAARLVLNRDDAILQPPYPLTGRLRLTPLGYPKEITIEAGWVGATAG
jgi:hypothetical protein